jgi:leucine dehydrogenase
MTYKSAIAQVGFGGGKSVIIADPKRDKTPELLRSFGAAVQSLGGRYICAEDVGCTTEDVRIVRQQTQYVVGLPHEKSSGDPGPFTAWGTFRGIETCATKLFGSPSLVGKSVAIQGLGNVGAKLVEYLFWAGAKVLIADIDQAKCERMSAQWGAEVVPIEKILSVPCDIFAPCALGAVINDETIASFRCKAIAGCANNQLHRDEHALALMKQGILYAPDFVINAGGLLNVATELDAEGYLPTASQRKVHAIYDTLLAVFEIAETHRQSTHEAALALADYRLQYGIGRRERSPTFHHTPEM